MKETYLKKIKSFTVWKREDKAQRSWKEIWKNEKEKKKKKDNNVD